MVDYTESKSSMMMDTIQPMLNNSKAEKKASKYEILEIEEDENIQSIIEELENFDEVEFAQPNYKLSIFEVVQLEKSGDVQTTTGTMQEQIEIVVEQETEEEVVKKRLLKKN